MQTVTIPEQEYLQLKAAVAELQKAIQTMQAQMQAFMASIGEKSAKTWAKPKNGAAVQPKVSWKRGSGKHLVIYMADDFTAPLEDLKEYM
jgi:hypothetical protein